MIDQQLFNIDIKKILNQHNVKYVEKGEWLHMRCLFPDHQDKTPSFSINIKSFGYNCFSCNKRGRLSDLFKELGWSGDLGTPTVTVGLPPRKKLSISRARSKEKIFTKMPVPQGFTKIDTGKITKHLIYIIKRKLEKSINVFNVGYTEKDKRYKDRIIIPVHDDIGNYIFMEGRAIREVIKPKYYRPPKVHSKSILFNYHRCKKYDHVIVVEGILTSMYLWVYGYPAVCCFGASLSIDQIKLLTIFDRIYLCLDVDKAGIKGYAEAKGMIVGLGIEIFRVQLPRKQDADSIGIKKFEIYFKNSKRIY